MNYKSFLFSFSIHVLSNGLTDIETAWKRHLYRKLTDHLITNKQYYKWYLKTPDRLLFSVMHRSLLG